jgi:hypothetical protein
MNDLLELQDCDGGWRQYSQGCEMRSNFGNVERSRPDIFSHGRASTTAGSHRIFLARAAASRPIVL